MKVIFGARRVKGIRGRGARGKTLVLGMLKRNDKVYTQIIKTAQYQSYCQSQKEK